MVRIVNGFSADGVSATHRWYITVPAEQAVPLPPNTTFEQGACLGIPALTAWRAITTDGGVSGKTVFITGGAGAVGHYAIQFAKLLGAAEVITTVSSTPKADHASRAGADVIVYYRSEPVVERVRAATGGRGVDRIVEVDGSGNAALLPQLVSRDGLCVVYGSSGREVTYAFGPMIMIGVAARFFIVYELAPDVRREGGSRRSRAGWNADSFAMRSPRASPSPRSRRRTKRWSAAPS